MDQKFIELEGRMEQNISDLEDKMNQALAVQDTKENHRMDSMEAQIDARFNAMTKSLETIQKELHYQNRKLNYLSEKVNDYHTDFLHTEKNFRKALKKLEDGQDTIVAILRSRDLLPDAS